MTDGAPVPDPEVDPETYDREYYTHGCMGAEEWTESDGKSFSGLYAGALKMAALREGERILDIGCGRGDLVQTALQMGATQAVGIDYAPAAIELARETLRVAGNPEGGRIELADARRIPVDDDRFELATLLDVVEHLTPEELARTLGEAHRALAPGGRIFIHTMPNAVIYTVTYRLLRHARPGRAKRWPVDPRNDSERAMHVNEQTLRSLRGALRSAGFERLDVRLGEWIYTDFLPAQEGARVYRALARTPGLRQLGIGDLFATGYKPGG
jgi:ubiquinone/menaquinone biosynthesis C-methylase UbiE